MSSLTLFYHSLSSSYFAFQTGITEGNEKDFRVVLSTYSAGQATIKLRVEITASWIDEIVIPGAILEDEIQIQVISRYKMRSSMFILNIAVLNFGCKNSK